MNMSVVLAAALALAATTGCKDKAAAPSAGGAMTKMAEFKDRMCACTDDACARKVSSEMADWSKKQPSEKPAAMTADEQKRATELGTQLGECMLKATTGGTAMGTPAPAGSGSAVVDTGPGSAAGSGSAQPAAATAGLPKECDAYKAAVDRLKSCDKLSKQAQETMAKGYEDAAARWAAGSDELKASLAEACRGGTEAVLGVGKKQCGW